MRANDDNVVRTALNHGPVLYDSPFTNNGILNQHAPSDSYAGHNDTLFHQAQLADLNAAKDDRMVQAAFQQAGIIHKTVSRRQLNPWFMHRLRPAGPSVHRPAGVVKLEAVVLVEQIHMSFPQAVNCTHIPPIAFETVSEQIFNAIQHGWNDIFAEVMAGGWIGCIHQQMLFEVFPFE
ncbi:hypothetical protein D3C75_788700 [compost metagenome]